MTDQLLRYIREKYPLTEIDVGDMRALKANGMTFTVKAYRAKGLGHISVMRAKGFFGLMKMDTLIINPGEIELPLYSYDRIYAMGNDTQARHGLRYHDKRPPIRRTVHTHQCRRQANLQERIRQDTRGMRGKARRVDQNHESRNRSREEGEIGITKEG